MSRCASYMGSNNLEFRVRNSLLGYRGFIYICGGALPFNEGGWVGGWAGGWEEARAQHVLTHDSRVVHI
jgi:hypothetical protein